MRKFILIILLLISSLSLTNCSLFDFIYNENTSSGESNNIENTDDSTLLNICQSIICRSNENYTEHRFSFGESDNLFSIIFPSTRLIKEADGEHVIYYGVNKIGYISAISDFSEDGWKVLETHNGGNSHITSASYIEYSYDNNNSPTFRHRFVYIFNDGDIERAISFYVNYKEADGLTVFKLRESAKVVSKNIYTRYYDLKDLSDGNILILGNSFIASSKIGNILNEMFMINNKSCSVTAVSNGYATISKYIADEEIMNDLSEGKYDAVFICGLYSEEDLVNLKYLIEKCKNSNTRVVVFPAHNEKDFLIDDLSFRYPDIYCLNWKKELDMIISSGVRKYDLCINDSYSHSNPIAGFVGANIIYRAIYGESPDFQAMKTVNPEEVKNILNKYIESEYILDKIYYFD